MVISHKVLHFSFSTTPSGWCSYHFSPLLMSYNRVSSGPIYQSIYLSIRSERDCYRNSLVRHSQDSKKAVGQLKEKKWHKGPLAIGYGSLLWCNVGITSAGAKAFQLYYYYYLLIFYLLLLLLYDSEDVWMPYGSLSSQPGASNVIQAALRLTTL